MRKLWYEDPWEDYLYLASSNKKLFNKIASLIKDIERNGEDVGIGKPEALTC